MKKIPYKICRSLEEVIRVIEFCKKTRYASLDFETKAKGPRGSAKMNDDVPTGPAHIEDEPTILGVSFQPGAGYSIPLFHKESPFTREEALHILKLVGRELVENINIVKVCWNTKFEYRWFLRYGYVMRGVVLDGMLMKYLLEETPPNDLKSMVERFIPEYANYEDEVKNLMKKHGSWENIPMTPLSKYCVTDCDLTLRISLFLERKLMAKGYYSLFRNMCMMQVRVLGETEQMGLPIDSEYLDEIIKKQAREIKITLKKLMSHKKIRSFQRWRIQEQVKKLIKTTNLEILELEKIKDKDVSRQIKNRQEKISRYIAGELLTKKEVVNEVNFGSPKQLVDFLYLSPAGLKFKIIKYTKDKHTKQPTTTPSTDEEVLLILKNKDKSGFISALLDYREMTKLYSTYMIGIRDQLSSQNKVHGSFLIHGTVTGRLSSKAPNLQNIPRDTTSSLIKNMFMPPPGHLLLEVDYGQAELRVVAELSGDKAMIEIFKKNYNIHVATAAKINKKFHEYDRIKGILSTPDHEENLFWEKQKKRGKVLNFSILYLQSDFETANQLSSPEEIISVDDAAKFKAEWFEQFPEIKRWMVEQEKFVKANGYVVNMFGRKRRLPDIFSFDRGKQNKAIRDAINAPIQGTSSDFTQFASVCIRERRIKGNLIWTNDPNYQYQAYTVHDSMGYFVQPQYIHKVVPVINDICSNPETIHYFDFEMKKVKMRVSPEVGKTWGGLKEYNAWENYNKWI